MIELLILGVLFLIVGFGRLIFEKDYSPYVVILYISIGGICLHWYDLERNPQAIDVYRGKTTLKITYKDSIPIDSVVVFK